MKNWKRKGRLTPSLLRSKIKKKYKGRLPTKVMTDPFARKKIYYNKNGRAVVVK